MGEVPHCVGVGAYDPAVTQSLDAPEPLHKNAAAVQSALDSLGVLGRVRALPEPAPSAATAAAQLGVDVGAIANSLLFAAIPAASSASTVAPHEVPSTAVPLLVMTSGSHRVNTSWVAAEHGFTSLKRADPDFVRTHTGQPIGGVAPLGHPSQVRTLVDTALADHLVIWAAGGHPHYVFPTTFKELLRITDGTPAQVV